MNQYRLKAVVSGKIVELWKFESWQFRGLTQFKKTRIKNQEWSELQSQEKKYRSKLSNYRTKSTIRNLVNCNPSLKYFYTLTYAWTVKQRTLDVANYEFQKFIKQLNYQNDDKIKYIVVVEFQARQEVHYHLVANYKIKQNKLNKLWSYGAATVDRVRTTKGIAFYFAKHGTKDRTKVENELLAGRKKFFHSRNLKKPKIFYEGKKLTSLKFQCQKSEKLFEKNYQDYKGELVHYEIYKLK